MIGSHANAWKNTVMLISLVREPMVWVRLADRVCRIDAMSTGTDAKKAICEDVAPSAMP